MALTFADKLLKWGYDENNGPDKWHEWFPVAQAGVRQSPIDIVTTDIVTTDTRGDLGPLRPRYRPATLANVENTSKSFQVSFFDKGFSSLTGGPLTGEYQVGNTRWKGKHPQHPPFTIKGCPDARALGRLSRSWQ